MPASHLLALGAIALWATLASLGTALSHLPPFLLTGLALAIGSVLSLPSVMRDRRSWRVPARTLALGTVAGFGFGLVGIAARVLNGFAPLTLLRDPAAYAVAATITIPVTTPARTPLCVASDHCYASGALHRY